MVNAAADITTTLENHLSSDNPMVHFEVVLERIYSVEEANNVISNLEIFLGEAANLAGITNYKVGLRSVQSKVTNRYHLLGTASRELYEKAFDASPSNVNCCVSDSGYVLPLKFKRQIRYIRIIPENAESGIRNRITDVVHGGSTYSPINRVTSYLSQDLF